MPEPTLIEQQREIIHSFRQVGAKRASAEDEAEARFKGERTAASSDLETARKEARATIERERKVVEERLLKERTIAQSQATALLQNAEAGLAHARQALEDGRGALSRLRRWDLLEKAPPTLPAARPNANLNLEFSNSVSSATTAVRIIETAVAEVSQRRWTMRIRVAALCFSMPLIAWLTALALPAAFPMSASMLGGLVIFTFPVFVLLLLVTFGTVNRAAGAGDE